ncbi:hypothetical protein [Marinobacter nauticus]|uniref:Uncharacterized protein n=1 Tax=Marinobacter nauticus (strain ATCC 700491 / DSM 11845 / VT8) TaxID=351348 RepID=A1U3R8_MARN8|nr:hypothetical protein [Marinobacter nauticus]ABM19637.1 hypothetical protein Maqu_2562 [Marinobacter nauticus VT8]
MMDIRERLVELRDSVESGAIGVDSLQRQLSQLLLASELENFEEAVKKFDNDLELVIYTISPSNQVREALKVLDEVFLYLDEYDLN